jgi:hypothetical protein
VHDRGIAAARVLRARVLAALASGAAVALLLAACSPGADYPTLLDKPMPRADQPMTKEQVQQATTSLVNDRDQLSTEARAAQAGAVASGMATPPAPATTGTTPGAGATTKP